MYFSFFLLLHLFAVNLSPSSVTNSDDKALVEGILESLLEIIGDERKNRPFVELQKDHNNVAAYDSYNYQIVFDERALEICKTMGALRDDAIAFILGHELVHYYHHHDKKNFLPDRKTYNKEQEEEREADLYGAFYAQLAGYELDEVVSPLFEKIYKVYGFEKKSARYPPLEERIALAESRCEIANKYKQIYKMGGVLLATGEYAAAIACFAYVGQNIKFQENYLNLGAAYLELALGQIPDPHKHPDYPIMASLESPFRDAPAKRPVEVEALLKAERNLRLSLDYAPESLAARFNLYGVYDMQKKKSSVKAIQQELKAREAYFGEWEKAAFVILQAITLSREDSAKREEAADSLNKLINNSRTPAYLRAVAKNNLKWIREEPKSWPSDGSIKIKDRIAGFNILIPEHGAVFINEPLNQAAKVHFTASTKERSHILNLKIGAKQFWVQHIETRDYATQNGIKVGSTMQALQSAYPDYKLGPAHNRGGWALVSSSGLFFSVNSLGRVEEWGVYRF